MFVAPNLTSERRRQEGAALVERHMRIVAAAESEQRSGRPADCEYGFLSLVSSFFFSLSPPFFPLPVPPSRT